MIEHYRGLKYYGADCMFDSDDIEKAKRIVLSFGESGNIKDINQLLELYNAKRLVDDPRMISDETVPLQTKCKEIMSYIAHFFRKLDGVSLPSVYKKVDISYTDDFWLLFNKFKTYEIISKSVFRDFLNMFDGVILHILRFEEIVKEYDSEITIFLRNYDQSAWILVNHHFGRKQTKKNTLYFPPSFGPRDCETIIERYIDSDDLEIGMLKLIMTAPQKPDCPISDALRYKAEQKMHELVNNPQKMTLTYSWGTGVKLQDIPEIKRFETVSPREFWLCYDQSWLRENLDYPTVLNNYIYIFDYVDLQYRCWFTSVKSKMNSIERIFGTKGDKSYETGSLQKFMDMKSSLEMQMYIEFLADNGVKLEEVIAWFFRDYLLEEFGAEGFLFISPSIESSYLEKCRHILAEMEGVLKQFKMYVSCGAIDRGVLEMSSGAISFATLPSLLKNKYAYACSDEIKQEMTWLFSEQSMLQYTRNKKYMCKNFFDLVSNHTVSIDEYSDQMTQRITWLQKRGDVIISEDGTIKISEERVRLLKDLYEHDVVCCSYWGNKILIEQLTLSQDLVLEDTLFTRLETEYMNYILNKSKYSDGPELRNRYMHGTNSVDARQNYSDYISILKILMLMVLKINEEFCLCNLEKNSEEKREDNSYFE